MWQALIGPVADIAKQFLKNRAEKSQAKHKREIAVIKGEIDADVASAENMAGSIKDEYLTLVFTTPLIIAFYAAIVGDIEMMTRVREGVAVLDTMPEWYQWSIVGIVAASFGIRTFDRFKK